MRTIQISAIVFTIIGLTLGYWTLANIEGESGSTASAMGLVILFAVFPCFGISALLSITSSLSLLSSKVRDEFYFKGKFWLGVLSINSILSTGYMLLSIYLAYIWITTA
jgi:hypothetical protein